MKVLFLTNIPSPYRIDFFHELGRYCELTVWFEARTEANREWAVSYAEKSFRYKFLPGRTLGIDKHMNLSIIRELSAEPFDVYIISGYSSPTEMLAIHWLKLHRKRYLLNSDGGFPAAGEGWFARRVKQYLISSADGWLSSGSNCTRYLRHYGARAHQIHEYPFSSVYYTEQELEPLREEVKARLKQQEGLRDRVLLSVGQFISRKGFDVLLRAFSLLSAKDDNVTLLLIGGGPERADYETYIYENGIRNVVIKDFMQRRELIPYWKLADLFVMPTRYDIWGLVVNEALSFGLPVVSTSMAGAAHDLVKDGENGFLVDPDSAGQLVDRCALLLSDRALRDRFAARSRELAADYTLERMVARHVHILEHFSLDNRSATVK